MRVTVPSPFGDSPFDGARPSTGSERMGAHQHGSPPACAPGTLGSIMITSEGSIASVDLFARRRLC